MFIGYEISFIHRFSQRVAFGGQVSSAQVYFPLEKGIKGDVFRYRIGRSQVQLGNEGSARISLLCVIRVP